MKIMKMTTLLISISNKSANITDKTSRFPLPRARQRGFTLVEILVVVAIIAILISGIVGVGSFVHTNSQIKNTKNVIRAVVAALEEYRNYKQVPGTFFDFPDNVIDIPGDDEYDIIGLYLILNKVPSCKTILDRIPESNKEIDIAGNIILIDAWRDGADYRQLLYYYMGSGNFPVIRSAGPDMVYDTEDDIISTDL